MTMLESRNIFNNVLLIFIQDSTDEKIPMCVIGNKVDLREQLPEGSCVSSLHGEKLAKVCNFSLDRRRPPRCLNKQTSFRYTVPFFLQAYGALFCETSAKEGTNVVETVLHLAR